MRHHPFVRLVPGMTFRHVFLASLFAFLCLSCAAPQPRPPGAAEVLETQEQFPVRPPAAELEQRWREHAAVTTSVSQWELRGRLAVRLDERGGQATLNWTRDAARHVIRLNGPFGSGAVRVIQDASGARLRDAENREFAAASAEELLFQYTGWQLPVAYLDWWVRGLPVPDMDAVRELDETGRLKVLRQQGWEIRYAQYTRIDRYHLPLRLTLARAPQEGAPPMEARLVIDRWTRVK